MTPEPIIARLEETVGALSRVAGAADLAALLQAPPQAASGAQAHVVLTGLFGGAVETGAGTFVQSVDRGLAVYLTFAAHGDRLGTRAQPSIDETVAAVIAAIAGWAPDDATVGVFRLVRGQLQSIDRGVIVWVIEFAIADQLRILS